MKEKKGGPNWLGDRRAVGAQTSARRLEETTGRQEGVNKKRNGGLGGGGGGESESRAGQRGEGCWQWAWGSEGTEPEVLGGSGGGKAGHENRREVD